MLFKNFDKFYEAAMDLLTTQPNKTRMTIKSVKRKTLLKITVTNGKNVKYLNLLKTSLNMFSI
jgi:hypothetical protein